jgi:hypothetical protein
MGACCSQTGICTVTEEDDCDAPSAWQGVDTDCSPNPCPQPTGACCTPQGSCTVTTSASCNSPNIWQGVDTDCDPNPCPPPVITVNPSTVPNGALGVPYSQSFTASGGTAPYTYAVSAGALPTGLTLAANGSLTGTPSSAGDFNFTVRATDALAYTGTRAYSINVSASTLDLTVPVVYITQATQTQAFDVPLVADRNGLLRAFVVANQANSATPSVRVRIYNAADALVQTYTIPAPGASVGTSITEGTLASSWNQLVPGSLLQPGYSVLVDVDPTDAVSESNNANNHWPVSGTPDDLDVRELSELMMTLVPVDGPVGTGNVTVGNAASFMDHTRRMHPIPDYDVTVRAALSSETPLENDGDGWETVLNEVTLQRTIDGSSRYYYGVVKVNYGSGVAGLGWIGYPVAIGWDYLPSGDWVLAHEVGHNFERYHTACSGEGGTDPGYPYAGGAIGAYGSDLWTSTQLDKNTTKDIMSYCGPQWISEYTYKGVLSYREDSPYDRPAPPEACLLVWGTRRGGAVQLEPSFHLTTRPALPAPGPFRVEGLDESGAVIWSRSFAMMDITHLPEADAAGFNFAVPMAESLLDRIATLRIVENGHEKARRDSPTESGPRFRQTRAPGRVERLESALELSWDAAASPVVVARDLDSGECLGVFRGGSARIADGSRRIALHYSDGVHTRVETWAGR